MMASEEGAGFSFFLHFSFFFVYIVFPCWKCLMDTSIYILIELGYLFVCLLDIPA